MIASHAPALVAHKAPHGKHVQAVLLLVGYHGHHHVQVAFRLDQLQEWVLGPVSVPDREYGIVGKSKRLMDVSVYTTVLVVYIHIDRWVNHGVI